MPCNHLPNCRSVLGHRKSETSVTTNMFSECSSIKRYLPSTQKPLCGKKEILSFIETILHPRIDWTLFHAAGYSLTFSTKSDLIDWSIFLLWWTKPVVYLEEEFDKEMFITDILDNKNVSFSYLQISISWQNSSFGQVLYWCVTLGPPLCQNKLQSHILTMFSVFLFSLVTDWHDRLSAWLTLIIIRAWNHCIIHCKKRWTISSTKCDLYERDVLP